MRIFVQDAPFDLGAETAAFAQAQNSMGAIVTFTGVVRDTPDHALDVMEIEHYPGMTEKAISSIAEQAIKRFGLGDALIIHRHGRLAPGEVIMMVATAARHRKHAPRSGNVKSAMMGRTGWRREMRMKTHYRAGQNLDLNQSIVRVPLLGW